MKLFEHILKFYKELEIPRFLPEGIEVMNPYASSDVISNLNSFYSKYYNDDNSRVMMIGINPGRFGGGITGIPFTDPVNLEKVCEVPNGLPGRHELSSKFVYEMIRSLGGPGRFYSRIYITAVSPLGFIQKGRNINYYDVSELLDQWKPFMVNSIRQQAAFCGNRKVCFSMGQGKNFKYLQKWNDQYEIFDEVRALPHPRWIMQYRLKRKEEFIRMYKESLEDYF